MSEHKKHWIQHLLDNSHCRFPKLNDGYEFGRGVGAVEVDLRYHQDEVLNQNKLCVAWGLVLRLYSGNSRVSFAAVNKQVRSEAGQKLSAVTFDVDVE